MRRKEACKLMVVVLLLLVNILTSECLVFERTNLDLYHPAVSGETVLIDCSTDDKNAALQLVKKDQKTGDETVLEPDDLRLKLSGQQYTVLITDERDAGEYICRARSNSITVQKSKVIFIGGKVLAGVPTKPVIRKFSTLVHEGRRFSIECSTRWYFAKLTWTKDNYSLVPSSWITQQKPAYENGNIIVVSKLTIEDMRIQDEGTYTCHSTSRFDKYKRSSASVDVKVKPVRLQWLVDRQATYNHIMAVLGASASLSCAMSHPAEKISFFRRVSGSPPRLIVPNNDKYQLINNQELVIRKVSLLDYGTYICKSKNFKRDKTIQLFINSYTEAIPYVKVRPQLLELDFFSSAQVSCLTYGINSKIVWLKKMLTHGTEGFKPVFNTVPLQANRTKQGLWEQQTMLVFTNATVERRGTYLCKVSNGNGSTTFKQVSVDVKDPQTPEIKRFNTERAKVHQKANLFCKSKGAPEPSIKFFKDGVEITSNTRGYKIAGKGKKLTVNSAKFPDHDGVYSCNVTNMFGRASASARLIVTVPPILDKSRKYIAVARHEQLKATCKVKHSNPVPSIEWLYQPWPCPSEGYNCKPLKSTWRTPAAAFIDPSHGNQTMTSTFSIPKSKVTRFFIRCKASHAYGSDEHEMTAIIDQRDARKNLKTEPPKVTTDEDESFTLTCTGAAGLFINLSWFKDSRRVVHRGSSIVIVNQGAMLEERVSSLTITRARVKDSGNYTCVAKLIKSEEKPISALSQVTITKIHPPKVISFTSQSASQAKFPSRDVMDGKQAVLKCTVTGHPAVSVKWYKDNMLLDDEIRSIASVKDCDSTAIGSYFTLDNHAKGNGTLTYELVICKTSWKKNNGSYTCRGSNHLGTDEKVKSLFVGDVPTFKQAQQVGESGEYLRSGSNYFTNCSAEGNPTPHVWWERSDGNHGDKCDNNNGYTIVTQNSSNGMSWLNITGISVFGKYRCVANNRFGRKCQQIKLQMTPVDAAWRRRDELTTIYLLIIVMAAVILMIIVTILSVILFKRKKLYGGFYILSMPPSPDYFRTLDPTRPLSEQVHKLPYFPEWEFPREKVQMKNKLGGGQFGEVYIADVTGIFDFEPRYKLALKHRPLLSKERFSFSYFKRDKVKGSVKEGAQRPSSISEEDAKKVTIRRGSMDSVKTNKSKKSGKVKSMLVAVKKLKEDASNVEYKDLISEMKILIHIGQQDNVVNLLAACTKGFEKDTLVILEYCKHGDLLSFMKGRRQIFKPIWSKQHVGMEDEFTTFDLCVAAYQISKGLEFLASRRCVHRDVAARNVLVGANYVMKVADFGLARDVYHEQAYVKQTGGLLPLKWMAIESIIDRVFTHQSDVWAYGVLLWELMTLGGSPYPGINHQYLAEYLQEGNRMDQPQFCPNEIYVLMRDCWKTMPNERPTFSNIVLCLARVIESHCTDPEMLHHYLEKSHISGGTLSHGEEYLKPVDGAPFGSYKFSPPPTYSQSFEDRRLANDSEGERENIFGRQVSERYVPEKKRVVDNNAEGDNVECERADEAKDDDDERTYINEEQVPYVNELPRIDEHRVLIIDNEDDTNTETTALLSENNTSSTDTRTDGENNNNNDTNDNNTYMNMQTNDQNISHNDFGGNDAPEDPQYEQMGDENYMNV